MQRLFNRGELESDEDCKGGWLGWAYLNHSAMLPVVEVVSVLFSKIKYILFHPNISLKWVGYLLFLERFKPAWKSLLSSKMLCLSHNFISTILLITYLHLARSFHVCGPLDHGILIHQLCYTGYTGQKVILIDQCQIFIKNVQYRKN